MLVKVLKDIVGLTAIFSRAGSLALNQSAQMSDAAMLLGSLVVSVTLSANEVRVSALILQMSLQGTSSNLNFLASSARNLLF